jgi:hypothetical protein
MLQQRFGRLFRNEVATFDRLAVNNWLVIVRLGRSLFGACKQLQLGADVGLVWLVVVSSKRFLTVTKRNEVNG